MLQEDLLPYLRQLLIYLECCAPTANDQLKLDYFFPFVSWPAALAQLRICVEGRHRTMKVLNSFFSLLFFFFFFFIVSLLTVWRVFSVTAVSPSRSPWRRVTGDKCFWHVAKHFLWQFGGPHTAWGLSMASNYSCGGYLILYVSFLHYGVWCFILSKIILPCVNGSLHRNLAREKWGGQF